MKFHLPKKHLLDTSQVIAEGQNGTFYSNSNVTVTSYTMKEIISKNLRVDSSSLRWNILETPSFCDFKNHDSNVYKWTGTSAKLQLLKFDKFRVGAICNKHKAAYQLSVIGGSSYFLCESVVNSEADFSQITAMLLYENLEPMASRDICLQKSTEYIYNLKINTSK